MKKSSKKLIIIIFIILTFIAIAVTTVILIRNQNKQKEEYEMQEQYKREEEYNNLLVSVAKDMYEFEAEAEYHAEYILKIWYNAIFKKSDNRTDKYTYVESKYVSGYYNWVNFQEAIDNYLSTNKEKLQNLQEKEKEINNKLSELQNKPNEVYKNKLDIITEMYSIFSRIVSLVNSPTGAYKDYGNKYTNYMDEFEVEYKKLLILLPELKVE